jgi:hypothetical protein
VRWSSLGIDLLNLGISPFTSVALLLRFLLLTQANISEFHLINQFEQNQRKAVRSSVNIPPSGDDQGHNDGGRLMKKLLITTALVFAALPFSFDGVTPTVSKAHAVIGRPLTPFSVAGVHRRAVRRTFGIGANLGYRGVYHRNLGPYAYGPGWRGGWGGWGWNRPLYSAPVAWGGGWGGGWGGWGWNRPLYSATVGWGPGWGGWGWNRPLFGATVGWGGGWGGWGWNRPWRRPWW